MRAVRSVAAVPLVTFLFTWTLTTHGKFSVSGDEPHYLMIAESLRADRDLDLANNYAQDDGRLFGRSGAAVEFHAIRSRRGDLRSVHSTGLPIVVLPVYALAQAIAAAAPEPLLQRVRLNRGLLTYSIVGVFLIALTAIGLTLLAIALTSVVERRVAIALTTAAGISPPIVSHAFLVFPEVVALVVTCVTVWLALRPASARDETLALGVLLLIGLLPWLHHKYFLYAAGLAAFLWCMRRDHFRLLGPGRRAAAVAAFAVPQAGLLVWSHYEWGTIAGPIATGAVTEAAAPFSLATLRDGLVGLLLDRQSGLLAYAPLYWIVPACWWLTRQTTGIGALPFTLLYVPAAAFVVGWWGGFSPAARYLVPAMPLLLLPIAHALRHASVRRSAITLGIAQAAISAAVWHNPRWLWPAADGNRALLNLGAPGRAYEALLPSIRADGVNAHALAVMAMTLLLTLALVRSANSRTLPRHESIAPARRRAAGDGRSSS